MRTDFAVLAMKGRMWCRYVTFECPRVPRYQMFRGASGLPCTLVQHQVYFSPLYWTLVYIRHVVGNDGWNMPERKISRSDFVYLCTRLRKEFIVVMIIYDDGFILAVFTLNSRVWCRYVTFECPRVPRCQLCQGDSPVLLFQQPVYFGPLHLTWAHLRHVFRNWGNRADSNVRSPSMI